MKSNSPAFWGVIGFVLGFLVASGGDVKNPIDSLLGGFLQATIWFVVSKFILSRVKKD
jgi:hypothetical protein